MYSSKPHGLLVEEMFDPRLFQSGSCSLLPTSYGFKVDRLTYYHCLSCPRCKPSATLQSQCYFAVMLRCITHGWRPPFLQPITPQYSVSGNYATIALYHQAVDKEIQDMIHNGVLIQHTARPHSIFSPLGAVLKNSDRMRAKTLVHISIKDQASLSAASAALLAIGQPKIKCRVTTDSTASGLNKACYSPAFHYPALSDAISLLEMYCYLAIGDIQRYFHSFPLAIDDRFRYGVKYGGIDWTYARCWFGFSACPYYCSTWSAEFRRMLAALGIPTSHMMDDWITIGVSAEQAFEYMERITKFFEDIGLSMATDKFKYGQQLVYLGVLIDTINMTVRFDAIQSKGMRIQLTAYLEDIITGTHLDHTTIRHVCGKLNWYSELVQSGRVHLRSWWQYERYGRHLTKKPLLNLIEDTRWWISLLHTWESNTDSKLATYPIFSAKSLQDNPNLVYCIQSDASGPDGLGYFHSTLSDPDPSYVSQVWDPPLSTEEQHNSHAFELRALEHFLIVDCPIREKLLIWITDSESAVHSINKGSCKDPIGFRILVSILNKCDEYKISLLAIWTPREQNELADYLSHLANNINICTSRGRLSQLRR